MAGEPRGQDHVYADGYDPADPTFAPEGDQSHAGYESSEKCGSEYRHPANQRREGGRRAGLGRNVRAWARDVHQRIQEDGGQMPFFPWASQNITAAAALLQRLPEPATPEERRAQRDVQELLNLAARQQAESSILRWRDPTPSHQASSHPHARASTARVSVRSSNVPPERKRLGPICDAQAILSARRHDERDREHSVARDYNPRHGGRYDPRHDHSISPPTEPQRRGQDREDVPPPAGPRAFGRDILNAPVPQRYRAPSNITKYSEETNPRIWLEDYRLACLAGGADNEAFIIRNLPLYLADTTRAWLEHLPPASINSWMDLREIFVSHF